MILDEERAASRLGPYRLPGEQIRVAMQEHWAAKVEPPATAAFAFVLVLAINGYMPAPLGLLSNLAWWLWFPLLVRVAWELLNWQVSWFIASNKRLLLLYGVVVRKVAMMPLVKVTDMSYSRTPMGMVLGYGTFTLESAGQDQALQKITYVRDPDATYRAICSLIFGTPDPHHRSRQVPQPRPPASDDGPRDPDDEGPGGPDDGSDSPGDGPDEGHAQQGDPTDIPVRSMGSYLVGQGQSSLGRRILQRRGPARARRGDAAPGAEPLVGSSVGGADDQGWSVSHEDASPQEHLPRSAPNWWD